ncbi:MAG TPA: RHS repeat-associated core domain-containing protein [Polyangiales bacterium]
MGSTVALTKSDGTVKQAYRLDAWGNERGEYGTGDNRRIFTGKEHDKNTGLIYFGARFYDPETARFTTQDSYLGQQGTPPSLHRYLYAQGNPTVYGDRDGHSATVMGTALGAVWGFGQVVGALAYDSFSSDREVRSAGEYGTIFARNVAGGALIGASFDSSVMSGGLAATSAGVALGTAGFSLLTFDPGIRAPQLR